MRSTNGVRLKSEPLGDRSVLLARLGEGNLGSEGLLGRLLDGKGIWGARSGYEGARVGEHVGLGLGRRELSIRMAKGNGESKVGGAVGSDEWFLGFR